MKFAPSTPRNPRTFAKYKGHSGRPHPESFTNSRKSVSRMILMGVIWVMSDLI